MTKRTTAAVAIIGSSARALPAHLRATLEVCLRFGIVPVMTEHATAARPGSVEASLSLIDDADLYIGIFADQYGRVPDGYDKSISEMEYDRALARGIPRLVFVMKRDRLPDAATSDVGSDAGRLAAFISRVEAKQPTTPAPSPEEFRALLGYSLTALGIRSESRRGGAKGIRFGSAGVPKTALRLFVASPRDVQAEREGMPKVIESLNSTIGKLMNVVVELWRWEVDAPPAVGEPQALVNPELDQADIVVVIFWNRLGTSTLAGTTGTESEVLRSLKRWSEVRKPELMIYFCQRPTRLDRPELEQRLKLLEFRERLSSLVLAIDYEDTDAFLWRVRDDLFLVISKLWLQGN